MVRRNILGTLLVGVALSSAGCISINGHWGPGVWTEKSTERMAVDTTGLKRIEVNTHNGFIHFTGTSGEAYVVVTKKTRGLTADDAARAMDALEVFVESAGEGTQRIGYRWKGIKSPTWVASVAFDIHAPSEIDLSGATHNGRVNITGLAGDLTFATHNGAITADTSGAKLTAATHNGGIQATFSGRDLNLATHNGSITADLAGCQVVRGRIETHNGGVEMTVDDSTSLELDVQTENGGIRCSVPMQEKEKSRRRLVGKIGDGGELLAIRTHNGSVHVVQ